MKAEIRLLGGGLEEWEAIVVEGVQADAGPLLAVQVGEARYKVVKPPGPQAGVRRLESVSGRNARALLRAGYQRQIVGTLVR